MLIGLVRFRFFSLLLVLSCGTAVAQDIHILLRPKNGKNWFHLGEPITMEVACVAAGTQRFLLPCDVVLQVKPVSIDSRVSADRAGAIMMQDAECGNLPPKPRGMCGTMSSQPPHQQSQKLVWQEAKLGEPFPATVGDYAITAVLAYDLELNEQFQQGEALSTSNVVEISTDDDMGWKAKLLQFKGCDYDDELTILPDDDVIKILRRHLNNCAVEEDESFGKLMREIVWLELQVKRPEMYTRIKELEAYQPVEGEQPAEGEESKRIGQWFHDGYRDLLLETARQLVSTYKSHPELSHDDDFSNNLESGFENWYEAAASLCGGADSYISHDEVVKFLKDAGRSREYIETFLKTQKDDVPAISPVDSDPAVAR
jgi:hypothetical protein